MKFTFATALLAFTNVNAVEVAAEADAEWSNAYGSSMGYISNAILAPQPKLLLKKSPLLLKKQPLLLQSSPMLSMYNGHGHHSYSDYSSSDMSSYDSLDYSSSDYGLGYRSIQGAKKHYRYTPKYSSGRYMYGSRYASNSGIWKAPYRALPSRSYSACLNCQKPLLSQGYGLLASGLQLNKW